MNTLKTAVVVIVLLGVLYGVYQVLNAPDQHLLDGQTLPSFGDVASESGGGPAVDLGQLQPTGPDGGFADLQIGMPDADGGSSSREASPAIVSAEDLTARSGAATADSLPSAEAHGSSDSASQIGSISPPLPPTGAGELVDDSPARETEEIDSAEATADSTQRASQRFQQALDEARELIQESRFREALATLSPFYDLPGITAEEQRELLSYLDPLAGKVIYSMEHRLEDPYIVRRGDSLEDLARNHDVAPKLIENINKSEINDPRVLLPGTELKVLRGPFRAEVRLDQKKLTVFLNDLYAGRFDIGVGDDPSPREGVYHVEDKRQWQEYSTRSGQTIPQGHPANPFGQWWIDLGSEVSIHGSPEVTNPNQPTGCISLSPIDAADVYAILSEGSRIEIRR